MKGVPSRSVDASVRERSANVANEPRPSTVISTGLSNDEREVRRDILHPRICFWIVSISLKMVKELIAVVSDVPYVHAPSTVDADEAFIAMLWKWRMSYFGADVRLSGMYVRENGYSFLDTTTSSMRRLSVSPGCLRPRISFVLKRVSVGALIIRPGSQKCVELGSSSVSSMEYCHECWCPNFGMESTSYL